LTVIKADQQQRFQKIEDQRINKELDLSKAGSDSIDTPGNEEKNLRGSTEGKDSERRRGAMRILRFVKRHSEAGKEP
jgi:hypothetical protein